MTSVLVTGGAGFLGSRLVDRLVLAGHRVTVLDDLSRGSMGNLDRARRGADRPLRFQRCDVVTETLAPLVARADPEVVFHLAARSSVAHSVADPTDDATVTVIGALRVLEACRLAGVRKIVVAGDAGAMYGGVPAAALPVAEDDDSAPLAPHGAAHRAVEQYCRAYGALHGLEWTALAVGSVYGPRPTPVPDTDVVATFATRMLAGHGVTIHGDGKQTRDLVFVDDVVGALVAAMAEGSQGRCNVGTGTATSVNQLFDELADLTGYSQQPYMAAERPGEHRACRLDIARAAAVLDWRPWTTLDAGLAATVAALRT